MLYTCGKANHSSNYKTGMQVLRSLFSHEKTSTLRALAMHDPSGLSTLSGSCRPRPANDRQIRSTLAASRHRRAQHLHYPQATRTGPADACQFVTARIANMRSLVPLQRGIKPPRLRPHSAGANLPTSLAQHYRLVTSFTPDMFFMKLFAAFATVAATATAVGAVSAAITAPAKGDLWTVGATQQVKWDTVGLASVDTKGRILLGYHSTSDDKRPHLQVGPLATDVDLQAGAVDVTVPDVTPGDKYLVTLAIGDSDVINVSDEFTIARKD